MRLYTVQAWGAWEQAQRVGVLTVSDVQWIDPYSRKAYRWMQEQMAVRLPAYSGDLPIWASLERPDLRHRWAAKGTPCVLLTIEVPEQRVLLSDFEGWHYVLNNWYLGLTEEEFRERDEREPTQEEIESTWSRIFGPFPMWQEWPDTELQACVDRVFLHEVIKVRPFTSR